MRTLHLLAAVLLPGLLAPGLARAQLEPGAIDPAVIDGYLEQALASRAPDAVMVGAMIAAYHAHPLYVQFLDLSVPEGHAALWTGSIASRCVADTAPSACMADTALEQFVASAPDNIFPHLLKVQWLLQQGSAADALQALANGLAAPDTNDHYWQRLALLRATLEASAYPADKRNQAAEAYADPLALLGVYNAVLLACREHGTLDESWARACMALGIRLENSGTSMFATVFGASIQRDVLLGTEPDAPELPLVLARREYYDDIRTTAGAVLDWWFDASLASKPDLFYADALAFGELRAIELAVARAAAP